MGIVNGVHILIYTANPEADRAFFREILGFKYVDVGHGWLIFGLPPAEAAFHPVDGNAGQQHAGHQMLASVVYLMCDDLEATVKALAAKKVARVDIANQTMSMSGDVVKEAERVIDQLRRADEGLRDVLQDIAER